MKCGGGNQCLDASDDETSFAIFIPFVVRVLFSFFFLIFPGLSTHAQQTERHIFVFSKSTWSKTISDEWHGLLVYVHRDYELIRKEEEEEDECIRAERERQENTQPNAHTDTYAVKIDKRKGEWEPRACFAFQTFCFCHLVPRSSCFIIYMLVSTPFRSFT